MLPSLALRLLAVLLAALERSLTRLTLRLLAALERSLARLGLRLLAALERSLARLGLRLLAALERSLTRLTLLTLLTLGDSLLAETLTTLSAALALHLLGVKTLLQRMLALSTTPLLPLPSLALLLTLVRRAEKRLFNLRNRFLNGRGHFVDRPFLLLSRKLLLGLIGPDTLRPLPSVLRASDSAKQIVARRSSLLHARFIGIWLAILQRIAFLHLERVILLRSLREQGCFANPIFAGQRLGASNARQCCYGTHYPYSIF
ncbi:hypothetical protein BH20PSE1_BH20PSE1_04230 [soil metagenome]